MWSSWPWVSTMASILSRRSRIQVKSGRITSTPGWCSSGNSTPQSTTRSRPACSKTVMLRPISPSPPNGTTRSPPGGSLGSVSLLLAPRRLIASPLEAVGRVNPCGPRSGPCQAPSLVHGQLSSVSRCSGGMVERMPFVARFPMVTRRGHERHGRWLQSVLPPAGDVAIVHHHPRAPAGALRPDRRGACAGSANHAVALRQVARPRGPRRRISVQSSSAQFLRPRRPPACPPRPRSRVSARRLGHTQSAPTKRGGPYRTVCPARRQLEP